VEQTHTITTLPGGVRVVTEPLPGVRSLALGAWIGAGSRDEPAEHGGISHFIEHLLFRGSSRYTALEIAQVFDGLGGELNAETAREYTLLHARVLDSHVETALDVICDMLRHPTWSDLSAEREVVLEEIAMVNDTPDDLVHDLASLAVFGDEPLGRPVIGTEQTIEAIDVAEVSAFHAAHYVDRSLVVSAAGSVEHERFAALVGDRLGQRPANGTPGGVPLTAPRVAARRLFHEKETEQYHVCLAAPGLARADERRYAAALLDALLGGTASSRLFQEIRERRGMAYSVYSFGSHYAETGIVGVYVGTRPENVATCLQLIREQVELLAGGDVTPAELARFKEHLKGRIMLSLESTSARMSRLGKGVLTDVEILTPGQILERIEAVTPDEVAALAGELYAPARLSAAGVGEDGALFDAALGGAALLGDAA
jgi:predicted Zn-dependent peptidase